MKNIIILITLIISSMSLAETAPPSAAPPAGKITGTVVDSLINHPVEYANVILLAHNGESIGGTITDTNGKFELRRLRPGDYDLQIKFMGYHQKDISKVSVKSANAVDLGTINIEQAILEMQGIEAVAERPAMEYKIDKKVVNVGKQYASASGTAVDVLENVPSVTVDLEGNVSLRGSGSFRVLIDGRPTVLDPTDALKQIPATSIENIEIITNPSAKYDPDGTSGIVNIVSKKNSLNGMSGMATLNAGLNDKYGTDVLLNYRTGDYNFYIGGDYNKHNFSGTSSQISKTTIGDSVFNANSDGDRGRIFERYSVRAGVDWNVTDNNLLGWSMRLGGRQMEMNSTLDYDEWYDPGGERNAYTSIGNFSRGGDYFTTNFNLTHKFPKAGHEIYAEVNYEYEKDGDEVSNDELLDAAGMIQSGRQSTEGGDENELRLKLDYTLPLRENEKFEAGYQSRINTSTEESSFYEYSVERMLYELQPDFNNTVDYLHNIHALYAMYANEWGKFGVQGGLRGEYTDRSVELVGKNEDAVIDRWDYFPTLHLSYKFSETRQFMTSYTRRIERPRGYYLEPFLTWMDAYNVRTGNPGIEPEYIDSYEAAFQHYFGKNFFSVEAYHRVTHNKIERVQSVYKDNVILQTIDNVGTDYTLGVEAMFSWDIAKWWNANVMGNLYDYRIEGVLYDEAFERSSFNWSSRVNNTIKIGKSSRLQFNLMYRSPTVSAQGRREGFFMTDMAFRQEFFDKKLEGILQVRDLFGTGKYEFTSEGPGFYREMQFTRESPVVMLTLNYYINNYKPKRGNGSNAGSSSGGEGMDF